MRPLHKQLAIAAALLAALACSIVPGRGTLLTVNALFPSSVQPTQLEFRGDTSSKNIFGPTARPEPAGAALASPQSVRVELNGDLNGQDLIVSVRALSNGAAIASGSATQHISGGTAMSLDVQLTPIDGGVIDGGNVDAGCSDCAGCCLGDQCLASAFPTCGSPGTVCSVCDVNSDGCYGDRCGCDGGAACSTNADTCVAGMCVCGSTGAACPSGQACENGACTCNSTSCPSGCCDGQNHCITPQFASCGLGGRSCVTCPSSNSDACSDGSCVCGDGGACGAGQQCVNHKCTCTPASCPSGCCAGDMCLLGDDAGACGSGGAACSACPSGQTCEGGACSGCTAVTCALGCCSGSTCVTPPTELQCGATGGACSFCGTEVADSCSNGACSCGTNGPCASGQHCVSGACTCDATSCAGCCNGTTCVTAETDTLCGAPGATCARCQNGTSCDGGACVSAACDATHCPSGCCDNSNVCQPGDTANACGAGGGKCSPCGGNKFCDAGACVPDCGPGNCPGCCAGGTCMTGDAKNDCGIGGEACASCSGGRKCTSGVCQ